MPNRLLAVFLAAAAAVANAQWLNQPKAGVPRTPDGKPNLSARVPRAKGKPDLTGLWQADQAAKGEIERLIPGLKDSEVPGDEPTTFSRYFFNILADYRPQDVTLTLAAEKVLQANQSVDDVNGPRCLPASSPMNDVFPSPKRFVHTPSLLVILYEGDIPRQIHLDGRKLPVDPQPAWVGYSVGHWNGDTLVVETSGFNDRPPLDGFGHPRSTGLRMVERMRRLDYGHMETEVTLIDPNYYSKPITFRYKQTLVPDDDLLEWVCTENERDAPHMKLR